MDNHIVIPIAARISREELRERPGVWLRGRIRSATARIGLGSRKSDPIGRWCVRHSGLGSDRDVHHDTQFTVMLAVAILVGALILHLAGVN